MRIVRMSATYDRPFNWPRPLFRNSAEVLTHLAETHNISAQIIIGRSRKDKFVKIRHEFFYICMGLPGMTASKLGRLYGYNHATILHGISSYAQKNDLPQLTEVDAHKLRGARVKLYCAQKVARLNTLAPSRY